VTLGTGEDNLNQDFGYQQDLGSIGDTIFLDENGNGTPDDGEGIAGVEVKLDIDSDGTFDATQTTGSDGKYLFDGLNSGDYTVMVDTDTLPDDVVNTVDPDGGNDSMSDVTLGTGEDNLNQDFGYQQPEPQNPGIEIQKFVNGEDANTAEEAIEIAPGADAKFTYKVKNTGNVSFPKDEVIVTDDNGTPDDTSDDFNPDPVLDGDFNEGDANQNNELDPDETWHYTKTLPAEDLSVSTATTTNHVIDFEGFDAGTVIDDQYANLGVTISATGGSNEAMIFDSSNPTGGDDDLATPGDGPNNTTAQGNILIISEDGDSSDPDDKAGGGTITFEFDENNPVDVNSLSFVDIEESGGKVFTTDADGNVKTTNIPAPGDNSFQTLGINDDDVVKLEVKLKGSGSVSSLDFDKITTETAPGLYTNIGKVTVGDESDTDPANYVNPEPDPQNPGINIEKFVNGIDVTDLNNLPEIAAGADVTFTYTVENTGNVDFTANEVIISDDNGTPDDTGDDFIPTLVASTDVGSDGILSAGETWTYTSATEEAQDLTVTTSSQDITFTLTGNSSTIGSNGNVRKFTQDGVSVDVSAFSSNKSGGNWKTAYLGAYGGGLGVTNRNESGSHHRVDNGHSNDYILFEFDEEVTVDRAFLSSISQDSDISVWIGDRDGDISLLNSDILNDFTKENKNGGRGGSDRARWANFNADELTGDTLVIAAKTNDSNDAFKLKKLDISVPGETSIGNYVNIGTVTAGSVSDEDQSGYTNPEGEPEPQNPGIDIEKFTKGPDATKKDADTPDEAVEIAAGETVTWTYEVTNTGNVPFDKADIKVTDDKEGDITTLLNQDDTLDPGETWTYQQTGIAEDLTTTTSSEDITFHLTGHSYTTGHYGNVRTFSQDGVSVDVSAFSSNKSGGDWKKAYLGAYGSGLGVTNQNEGGSGHLVDNGVSNDYILFEFDKEVTVDRAFLDYVSGDSDITAWIGNRDGDITNLNSDILNDFAKENNNGGNYDRWADFNADELKGDTLVIAARTDHNHDAFKLRKLDVSVPGETSSGVYENIGSVSVNGFPGITDEDWSHYVNPDFNI
ncbi:DUF7507 domain-containing protein, partial [Dapis sp. BLCC M229]|uniref:DUF7507 domain-containing protein n=1 Tax=Dapis sp. BLCC M229 TaxID=3400188 RepID=UPI003CEAFDE0